MLTHFEMSPVDILNEVSVGRQAGNDDSVRDAKWLKGRKLAEPQHKDLLGWCVSMCVCGRRGVAVDVLTHNES